MKILVVDDEKTIVKGIKFNLENEGYQVDVCYDGETAVDMARRGEYAVILLDLMMPKLDGLVTRMEKKAEKNRAAVEKYAFWGLAILVAIPLPGTGAWTGALVAAMMEMRLKRAFPAIVIGVVMLRLIFIGLTMVGVPQDLQYLIKGAIILFACALDMRKYLVKK